MLTSFRKHPLAADIDLTRHHQMMKEMVRNISGGLIGAVLVWFIFKDSSKTSSQWLWFWANALAAVFSTIVYIVYKKKESVLSTSAWGCMSCFTMLLWGMVWSLSPGIYLQSADPVPVIILSSIIVGLCTSPTITMALYPAGYLAFISPILASLGWHLNLLDFGQSFITRLLPFIYWLFLVAYVINLHKSLIRTIQLQLEKTNALEEAELANISKSKFLASASHDLRQPLQAVNLFASALENELKTKDNQQLFENLQDSINSMSDLLSSLLDISKLDAQAIDVNSRDIELLPILDKLRDAYAPQAKLKQLDFIYEPADLVVKTDTVLIERMISNLLSNALRYTEKGSIRLAAAREGDDAVISISDTGAGIPENEQQAIFEEFHQLENPERDKQKGLGLGLAIVQRLCELLDHRVTLSSAVDKGSQFNIELDLGDKSAVETVDEHRSGRWDINQLRVLVLDDEESIRLGLQSLLVQWGCEVKCCESAQEVLEILPAWKPQLIVSDYRLRNHQTGSDAIEHISTSLNRSIPAILITGDTDPDRIKEAKESGHTLLHKPVKPAQLRVAIQHLVRN